MAEDGRLVVERFRAEYLVPADHPAPGALRARLDAAARSRLPRSLGAALERALPPGGAEVWLVRRLHVELEVEEEWDDARIAAAWAASVVRSLAGALAAGSPAVGNVLRFADRAAYLARFLADLAAGEAWGKWYYATFDGLRPLPTSMAVRTALLDDEDDGLRALLSLAVAERARVLAALSPADARRVLDGLPAGPEPGPREAWEALWRAWEALPPHAVAADAEMCTALELCLYCGVELRAAARALVRLARLLGMLDAPAAARLLPALRARGGGALQAAAPADADALAPLRDSPPGWVEGIARTLASAPTAATGAARGASPAELVTRATPFGAVFILLPFLDALPLDEAAEEWPAAGVTPAPAALRMLLACKALGAPRAARAFWDPVVRDTMGVGPSLTPAVVRGWARGLRGDALPRFLRTLAAWRRARNHVSARTLALCAEPLPGAPAAVLLDLPTGLWLWARGFARGRPAGAAADAAAWLASAGIEPETVLADPAFGEGAGALPGARALAADAAEADPRLAAMLARRPQLRGDLAWLAAPAPGLPRVADLALSVAAQGVLREVAARLPGFGASSLPYLHSRFLEVGAVVEVEPERWVARLGRPPLQFVLSTSGLARGEHHPRWLAHPVALCQEEGP